MTNHFNQLTEGQAERLAFLAEEAAEVIKAVTKILRHGYESYNPTIAVHHDERPETNRSMLEREIGDFICAMRKMRHVGDVSESNIDRCADQKATKSKRWLHHQ